MSKPLKYFIAGRSRDAFDDLARRAKELKRISRWVNEQLGNTPAQALDISLDGKGRPVIIVASSARAAIVRMMAPKIRVLLEQAFEKKLKAVPPVRVRPHYQPPKREQSVLKGPQHPDQVSQQLHAAADYLSNARLAKACRKLSKHIKR